MCDYLQVDHWVSLSESVCVAMARRKEVYFRYIIHVYNRKGKLVHQKSSRHFPKKAYLRQLIRNLPNPRRGWKQTGHQYNITISTHDNTFLKEIKITRYPPMVELLHLSDSDSFASSSDNDGFASSSDDDDDDHDVASSSSRVDDDGTNRM